jgi:RNA polymerase sigma-B factor
MQTRRSDSPETFRKSGEPRPSAAELEALFREYGRTKDVRLRNRLALAHERLVHYFAQRFAAGAGCTHEDLVQVGFMGLLNAVERFDPELGVNFVTFASPTIMGVIKRYLRDHTWALKVPRRMRELGISLRRIRERLESRLGRSPTLGEIAAEAGCSEEKVVEAIELERVYQPASLDSPSSDDGSNEGASAWEAIGGTDPRLEAIDEREMLRGAIGELDEREQRIIYGRFFGQASQSQVADQLGISQMHVSRLERQALKRLKDMLS